MRAYTHEGLGTPTTCESAQHFWLENPPKKLLTHLFLCCWRRRGFEPRVFVSRVQRSTNWATTSLHAWYTILDPRKPSSTDPTYKSDIKQEELFEENFFVNKLFELFVLISLQLVGQNTCMRWLARFFKATHCTRLGQTKQTGKWRPQATCWPYPSVSWCVSKGIGMYRWVRVFPHGEIKYQLNVTGDWPGQPKHAMMPIERYRHVQVDR